MTSSRLLKLLTLASIPLIGAIALLATGDCLAMDRVANPTVTSIKIPLTADRWRAVSSDPVDPKPDVQFFRHEGFPQGVLALKAGSAALNNFSFRNGTIEFDIKAIGEDIPGIQFRRQGPPGRQNAEEFYLRTSPDCRASDDCIQYTPIIHGFMLWNVYPQYQTQAFVLDGWNHVKLVVSGSRMNVFINRVPVPDLAIGKLESGSQEGGIQFRGPAYFANLVITPGAIEALPGQPTPDPTANDRGIVRRWQLAPFAPLHYGTTPAYSAMPSDPTQWKAVDTERFGLLNLDRQYQKPDAAATLNWLRYTVQSDREQQKHVSLGWLGHVWIFVNGKLITQGKNFYYPDYERRDPDGRLSLENGSFDIPLHKGSNEVAIALSAGTSDKDHARNHYGWGLKMRYDDPTGLSLPPNPQSNAASLALQTPPN